jgi:hypothetical protein
MERFEKRSRFCVQDVRPRGGPLSGKTAVNLVVDPIIDLTKMSADLGDIKVRDMVCQFSAIGLTLKVSADILDATHIECKTPRWQLKGKVLVSFAMNGVDFIQSESVMNFVYYSQPVISTLLPAASDIRGGTEITIEGQGFFDPELNRVWKASQCRFGKTVVNGTLDKDGSKLICMSPKVAAASTVDVEVSLNGVDFTSSDPPKTFIFFNTPVVQSLYPASGPDVGGTIVTLYGLNFRADTGKPQCTISPPTKAAATLDMHGNARVLSENRMVCTVPAVLASQRNSWSQVQCTLCLPIVPPAPSPPAHLVD